MLNLQIAGRVTLCSEIPDRRTKLKLDVTLERTYLSHSHGEF